MFLDQETVIPLSTREVLGFTWDKNIHLITSSNFFERDDLGMAEFESASVVMLTSALRQPLRINFRKFYCGVPYIHGRLF